ncbi:MAG: hypothetical protein L3J54_06295 [Draconibacterium sp.]|nr:hypothetical protein [Draconibacterium sp.]
MKQQIVDETNTATLNFISGHIDVEAPSNLIISSTSTFDIDKTGDTLALLVIDETNQLTYNYISSHIDLEAVESLVVSSTTQFEVEKSTHLFESIVNLRRLNDVGRINKFLESVNSKLRNGGLFVGNIDTYSLRKKKILERYPPVINWCVYTADFFVHRVSPKVWGFRKIYFLW